MANRPVAILLAFLGAAVFVGAAQAQGHGAFTAVPAGRTGMAGGHGHGVRTGSVRHHRAHLFFDGYGLWPYFYSDNDSEPGTMEAPPPQTIVVETASPNPPALVPNPPESLMLELQGDHWVRVTNHGQSQIVGELGETESEPKPKISSAVPLGALRRTQEAPPPSGLPPAVLVFRDGHEEEIRKYMILGAAIYTSADYWSSGSWTRKVEFVELDVSATLKLNQERGAKFRLPSGPNEIIIRP
jgi:hypothetical protein